MSSFVAIEILKDNRFLRSTQEVEAFDHALSMVAADLRTEDLPQLHLILDDGCENMEVMFGLVHLIETFPPRQHLCAFIQVLPDMVGQAREWTKIIHYRILNHHLCRQLYQALLRSAEDQAKDAVVIILEEIVSEEPECSQLGKSARELLHSVNAKQV